MPFLSVNRFFGIGKEATRGTAVTPTLWLPIDPNPSLAPNLTWIEDKGLRGSPVEVYDNIPGVRHDEFTFKGNVFADTFPGLMEGLIGADVVTGTAAPYTHTISLVNAPSSGSQPSSYTGIDTDNITESTNAAKQFTAGQLSDTTIDFAVDAPLTYSTKFLGNPFTEVATPTTDTWSTEVLIPAWSGSVTIGTVASTVVVSGSIDIKRSTAPIFTIGQQGPYRLWAGGIQVTGKIVFVAEANDPTFVNALTRDRQSFTITFTDPVSSHSVSWQMSAVQLKNPKVDGGKAYQTITADFEANSNSSDALTGYAPIKFVAVNGQSTAY